MKILGFNHSILTEKDLANLFLFNQYLSTERRERIEKIKILPVKINCIISEVLIRYFFIKYLDLKNDQIEIYKNLYGKLFVKNQKNYQFNISHSGNWVLFVAAKNDVGIDVEIQKNYHERIVEKYFHPNEFDIFKKLNHNEKTDYFYRLWTIKESYIKSIGKGFSIPLNSFYVKVQDNDISVYDRDNQKINYFCKEYYIDDFHKVAICSKENIFAQKIESVTINEFKRIF